jgi:uncharacterized protein (DUF1810 family)
VVDPYNLERFVQAQAFNYNDALAELRHGKKQTHWMWYVFPQIEGLGNSARACEFSIKSESEARAYLDHPLLGPRLLDIFGSPDDMKLRSCATLFARVPSDPVFQLILDKYFVGNADDRTLRLLGPQ